MLEQYAEVLLSRHIIIKNVSDLILVFHSLYAVIFRISIKIKIFTALNPEIII